MSSPLLAIFRFTLFILAVLACAGIQYAFVLLDSPRAITFPHAFHKLVIRIMGIRVIVKGQVSRTRPLLFVSNHVSYLDIPILGAVLPASFVSKAEVADWPLFGMLAKLQRTVFIERRRSHAGKQKGAMMERFEKKEALILFPEGTSGDGNRILPFKSALFSVADTHIDGQPLAVQPVSLSYVSLDGIPIGYHLRPNYAWYGDMTMGGHLFRVLGMGRTVVQVELHPPVTIDQFPSRKEMALHCQKLVAGGVGSALSGKPMNLLPRAA